MAKLPKLVELSEMTIAELCARIENYGFEMQAGPLRNCGEWIELRKRLGVPKAQAPSS